MPQRHTSTSKDATRLAGYCLLRERSSRRPRGVRGAQRPRWMTLPKLYGELAEWWHLMSLPGDYAEEAEIFVATFEEHAPAPIATMLELGSGGGNNASHMKKRYE